MTKKDCRINQEPLLLEMERYAEAHYVPIIKAQERELFQSIVRECQPGKVLEIGTGIGYSTLLLAEFTSPETAIVTIEQNEKRIELATDFIGRSPYADRIFIETGDAADVLPKLEGTFDLIFMDASKGQYVDYFRKMQHLLSEDAVILADNVLFRGYVLSGEWPPHEIRSMVMHLREYLDIVIHTPGLSTELYENGDGLAVTRRIRNDKKKT